MCRRCCSNLLYALFFLWFQTTLRRVTEWCCERPSKLLNLWGTKGCIAPGFDADFVVLDVRSAGFVVDPQDLRSRHKSTSPWIDLHMVVRIVLASFDRHRHQTPPLNITSPSLHSDVNTTYVSLVLSCLGWSCLVLHGLVLSCMVLSCLVFCSLLLFWLIGS